jgi:putative tricarboxylic transport membrane protein
LGALLLWEGFRIPNPRGYAGIGPADVPRLVGIGCLGLALWTAIAARTPAPERPRQNWPPVFWILAGLALQVGLLHSAGFAIATALLFACTAAAFGERRFLLSMTAGLALTLAIYGVFDRLLQLNLPAGPLERLIFGA